VFTFVTDAQLPPGEEQAALDGMIEERQEREELGEDEDEQVFLKKFIPRTLHDIDHQKAEQETQDLFILKTGEQSERLTSQLGGIQLESAAERKSKFSNKQENVESEPSEDETDLESELTL